ncbi:hypothetical protein [Mesorhizobium sp. KR1-2]|uniref:hypothetical protein n=1 Tax=Mesorhizobium sp. KR1-2 TaxID=3156609 RepID=UPI0032B41A86
MPAKQTVLFAVSEYGEFLSLISLADDMHAAWGIHPVFVFRADYGALDRHSQTVEHRGYSWVWEGSERTFFDMSRNDSGLDDYIPSHLVTEYQSELKFTKELIDNLKYEASEYSAFDNYIYLIEAKITSIIYYLFKAVGMRAKSDMIISRVLRGGVRRRIQNMRNVFRRFNPVLVVSGQDYPLSITTIAARVAGKRGISTAIVPFSMTPTTKEIAESFAGLQLNVLRPKQLKRVARLVGLRWVHRYRGRYYTRLPVLDILISNRNGLTPPQPWTPNSGAGIILAPSQQSVDYCMSAGIPANQLRLTGAIWNDELIEKAESRSMRRANLVRDIILTENYWRLSTDRDHSPLSEADTTRADKKLLIFSWPPNQWPRKAMGFASYDAFSIALVELLGTLMHAGIANVAISLHPTLVHTEVGELISKSGLHVTDVNLLDVIDCADIYCATVSSTLLWGLQLGIPSINFDIYRYQYREFNQAGMLEASSISQLKEHILALIGKTTVYEETAARMGAARDYWTIRDGKSRQRILAELKALMGPPKISGRKIIEYAASATTELPTTARREVSRAVRQNSPSQG